MSYDVSVSWLSLVPGLFLLISCLCNIAQHLQLQALRQHVLLLDRGHASHAVANTYLSSSNIRMAMRLMAKTAPSEGRGRPNRSNFYLHHLDTVVYGVGVKAGTDKVTGHSYADGQFPLLRPNTVREGTRRMTEP